MNFSQFQQNVISQIQPNIDAQIGVLLPICIAFLLLAALIIHTHTNSIMIPLNTLIQDAIQIENEDMEIDLTKGYQDSYYEVNELTQKFQDLNIVLKYCTDEYFQGTDAMQLIKYANALDIFKKTGNTKGEGIAYNNIGNIHSKNGRIKEAIESYQKGLEINERDFLFEVKCQHINLFYKVKPLHGWDSIKEKRIEFLQVDDISMKGKVMVNQTKKQALEEFYSNRLYNLSLAYMKLGKSDIISKREKLECWEKVIDSLLIVTKIDQLQDKKKSREIKAYIYLCEAYFQREELEEHHSNENDENLENALIKLNKAEDKLLAYEKVYDLFLEDQQLYDPPTILKQQILLQKGLIHKSLKNYQQACQYLYCCLEYGTIYATDVRNKCLQNLQEIFRAKGMIEKVPFLDKMLKENQRKANKDIIFLLDFSQSMNFGHRKKNALSALLQIFDNYIESEDRLAYLRFNQNVNIVFELNSMTKNTRFLRKQILETQDLIPSGETAFFQSMYEAIKMFKKVPKKPNKKWIIALTDGDDSCSTINQEKVAKLLKQEQIGLIIIGIALNQKYKEQLNELCNQTADGAFIDTVESNYMHIALQSISNLLHEIPVQAEGFITESFK